MARDPGKPLDVEHPVGRYAIMQPLLNGGMADANSPTDPGRFAALGKDFCEGHSSNVSHPSMQRQAPFVGQRK